MDESGMTQNRRARRSQMLMTASLDYSGRAVGVRLRNLSADGAQVEGDELPVEGTEVLFRKGDLAIAASVIWNQGKQAGLRFAQDLDPATVLNHVPVARPRQAAAFRRPGLAVKDLTGPERLLAETWVGKLPTPDR